MAQKNTRLEASCTSPSRSSRKFHRTWLQDSWNSLRLILPQGWKVTFVAYCWKSVTIHQTKIRPMCQWWWSRWHSRFRHCITSQKCIGSIPDGDIQILNLHNTSGLAVALGSNRPLTEMSTRVISRR